MYIYHIFFIHSPVNWHLGCFHILTIINNAAMNICVHVYFWISVFILFGYISRNGIAGSHGSSCRRKWQPTPSILAWIISWTEEPGRLQSMGSQESDMTWWLNHHHHGSSIFSFWGTSILFFIVGSPIYIPTNCEKGSFPPYFLQVLFVHFLRITILTGVRYLIVVFINNSLMISKVEHLFRCLLTICMSSLEKCLFWSPAHLLIRLGFFGFFSFALS